jgi:hypothetical protein
MLRFAFSAVALAAVLVTTHPSFADPLRAATSDYVQAAAGASEQPAPSPAAWSPSSDVAAPVGPGWG